MTGTEIAVQKRPRRPNEMPVYVWMERFRTIDPVTSCWRGVGTTAGVGYRALRVKTVLRYVHQLSYEHYVGPIPEGLDVDHVYARGCRYRDCWNPGHLEAVTRRVNLRRGLGGELRHLREAS